MTHAGEASPDDDLDQLLARTAVPPSPASLAATRDLAREIARGTAHGTRPPTARRRPRRRFVLAGAAAAALLCGAGTVAAYQLSIPPFQTVPSGVTRVRPPIVVAYTGVDDRRHRCQVFPEFVGLSDGQQDAAHAWAAAQDWTGYGDRVADRLPAATAEAQEQAVLDRVLGDVRARFAREMVPGASLDPAGDGPALSGDAAVCRVVADGS